MLKKYFVLMGLLLATQTADAMLRRVGALAGAAARPLANRLSAVPMTAAAPRVAATVHSKMPVHAGQPLRFLRTNPSGNYQEHDHDQKQSKSTWKQRFGWGSVGAVIAGGIGVDYASKQAAEIKRLKAEKESLERARRNDSIAKIIRSAHNVDLLISDMIANIKKDLAYATEIENVICRILEYHDGNGYAIHPDVFLAFAAINAKWAEKMATSAISNFSNMAHQQLLEMFNHAYYRPMQSDLYAQMKTRLGHYYNCASKKFVGCEAWNQSTLKAIYECIDSEWL